MNTNRAMKTGQSESGGRFTAILHRAMLSCAAGHATGTLPESASPESASPTVRRLCRSLLLPILLIGLPAQVAAQTAGVTLSSSTLTVAEDGGIDSYTVVLDTLPGGNVAVMASGDTATFTVAPPTLTFATSNWDQPQTVTVTGVNDDTHNTDDERTGTITHTISTADGGAYTTALTLDSVTVTVTDDDDPTLTVSLPNGETTIEEGGSPITARFTADPPVLQFLGHPRNFSTLTTGYILSTSLTNDVLTIPVDVEYRIDEDDENNMDQPNGTLTIDISVLSGFAAGSPSMVTLTVIDDDPTEVSLIRTGSTGAIDEGQAVTFTVELGRALVAGEIIEVPLSVTGTGTDVEPADWSLSATGTGVVLSNENTMTPLLRFEDAGAQTAELTLTAISDDTVEGGGSETYVIALGQDGDVPNGFDHSSLNTNVGGGADPHSGSNTFSVQVDDPTLSVSFPNGETTIEEGGSSVLVRFTADPLPSMVQFLGNPRNFSTITTGYRLFNTLISDNLVRPVDTEFSITDENMDQPNGILTFDVSDPRFAAGSPSMVTLTVIDNDPTEVSLIRTGSTGAIDEGQAVTFTVQLSRALVAGEIIDVPLAIDGTGGVVTPADWGLTEQAGIANTGVSLHRTDTATPFIRFSGAGAETALLQLAAALDDTDEGGSETFMIALGQDGSTTNGFDLPGRATNVGGGADPDGDNNRFELVVNDEGSTVLSIGIDSVTDAEGDAGETTFKTVTVSLSRSYSQDLVVSVRRSGSATRGTDYELVGTGDNNALSNFDPDRDFTITAGVTSVQFRIRVIGDTVFDIDETVVLTLIDVTTGISEAVTDVVISNIVGAVTHTIENDDPGGNVTVSRSALSMEEADGTASYTLVLDSQPGDEIILTVAGGEADTATVNTTGGIAGIEQTLTFTTMNWDQAQTVLVAAVNDDEDNAGGSRGSRRLTLTHAITTGDDAGYSTGLPVDAVVVTVVDDEATEVSLSYTGGSSVAEGDIVEFTVMLARALVAGETLDVPLQIGGTGGTPADWLLDSRSGSAGVSLLAGPVIRFAGAGARTATLELTTVLDGAVEGSGMETWSIALGDFGDSALAGGAAPRSGSNTFSVQVQDFAGTTVRIEADTTSVTEGTPARFTLTADPAPAVTLAVNLVVTDVAGSDFLASGDEGTQTVTIGTGGTFSYSLPTTADTLDEIDGPVTVAIADGTGYRAVGGRGSAAVTVNDDDDISLSITIDSASNNEGDNGETTRIVTVSLSRPYNRDLFPVLRLSGSATRGTDYQTIFDSQLLPPLNRDSGLGNFFALSNQSFYIPSGATSFQLRFRVMGDTAFEADETVMMTIIRPSFEPTPGLSISGTARSITHTIVNDDASGIMVNPDAVTVAEDGGTASYTLVPAGPPANTVVVTLTAGDGVTVDGGSGGTTLSFTSMNWATAQTVIVTAASNDGLDNPGDRTTQVTHAITASNDVAYPTTLSIDPVTVILADDEATTVTLAGDPGNVAEGDSKSLTLTLGRALEAGEQLTVRLIFGGTATFGTDYTLTGTTANGVDYGELSGGSVTFSAGGEVATLTLMARTDAEIETGGETVRIGLGTLDSNSGTNLGGGASGMGNVDFTIEEATAPTTVGITVNPASVTVAEDSGTDSYTVVLNTLPVGNVAVMVTSSDAATFTVAPLMLTFATSNWNQPQAVTVTGVDDDTDNTGDERTGTITHTISTADGGAYTTALELDSVAVTVTDDDATTVTLAGDPGNVAEGDSKPLTITLGRALEAGEQLTVRLIFGGTATFGTDYTLTGTTANGVDYGELSGGSVTFSAGGQIATLTLMAQTDAMAETGGETVRIGLGTLDSNSGTNLGGGASGMGNVDFTIEEATVPTTVGITVNPASVTVAEDSGTDSYTVVLNTLPVGNVAVMVTSSDAATFAVAPLMLTFATSNWNQPQAVTVTGVDDDTDNTGDERTGTITHTISTADGGAYTTVLELDSVAVTVTDDDATTVTLAGDPGNVAEGDSKPLTITLGRALEAGEQLTVRLIFGGTATFGTDYTLTGTTANGVDYSDLSGGSVTFSVGGQIATLTLMAQTDAMAETGGETVRIGLGTLDSNSGTNLGGGASGMGNVDFTIEDATVPTTVGITVNPASVTVAEDSGTDSYTVVLNTLPVGNVAVMVTSSDAATFTVAPLMLTFATSNWNQPQAVTVTGVNDDTDNTGDERTGTITHTISTADGGAYTTVLELDSVAVTVMDDDDPTLTEDPAIVLTPATAISLIEGSTTSYTVALATEPMAEVVITLSGATTALGADTDADMVGDQNTLTFSSDNWNEAQIVALTAGTDSNSVDETIVLTHMADSGYGSVTAEVTVTVRDADTPRLILGVNTLNVTEEGTATYTVRLGTRPGTNVTVTITGQSGTDLTVDSGDQLTFTQSNWNEEQLVTLSASADDDSDNDAVTLAHTAAGAEYNRVSAESLMVRIMDNTPALVLSTTEVLTLEVLTLQPGGSSSYTVALAIVPTADVIVTVMGHEDTGLTVAPESLTFSMGNWNMAQTITVTAGTDSNALSNREILTHMASGGNYDRVTAQIEVEVEVRVGSTEAMQAAQSMWLPRFGLTAIEHMLGGLHHRFAASDQPGLSGNLNGLPRGQSFNAARLLSSRGVPDASVLGIEQLGAGSSDRPRKLSRTLSLPKLLPSVLRGSHFTLSDEDGTSIWGRASYSSYKDADDGTSIDGEVTTAMLGVDHSSGRTLLGLALAYSDSDGEWQGQVESDKGELSGTLASLLPYLRYDLTERLQLWGAASYGRGDLEQTSETGSGIESEHDLEQVSATLGLRGTLLDRPVEEGGLSLKLTSDMTLARIEADDSEVMAGTEADTQRFRMGLEWSWQLPEGGGMRLTPELELGLRYDGGDTSEGFGLELGGGLNWQLPARGLTFDVRSRYLLEHEASGREEWGLSGSLRYKARPDSAHGPSFSLRHEYGNAPAASGLDRLLSDSLTDALKEDNADTADVSSRWTLKGEWGFALMDDATGIPYASLSASDAKRDLTLGWRLLSNPAGLKSKLDIKAIRREQDDNNPRHSVGAEWKLNW